MMPSTDPREAALLAQLLAIPAEALEDELVRIATALGRELESAGQMMCSAESCTGGAIARALTETAGSSAWFDRAFITYSNAAKQQMLQVPGPMLQAHGAVSEPVVRAMAEGALRAGGVARAVSVSGVAGPGGGSPDKPVGTVWFGWAWRDGEQLRQDARCLLLPGDRREVRLRTACFSLLWAQVFARTGGHPA